MAELQYVKELLATGAGTEGSLLIPRRIYDTIIDEALKVLYLVLKQAGTLDREKYRVQALT